MKRLAAAFERRKVLIAYLCVGDPSIDESIDLARACIYAGADIIELGMPFSDPTADGPAIARASQRAIRAGGGLTATLRAAKTLRASEPDVGIVLFGYFNPLFVRGEARVAREAADAGVDALLVVDLPLEEGAVLRSAAAGLDIGMVPLLAPTSRADRIAAVRETAKRLPLPFLYYVSITGVTGVGAIDAAEAGARAAQLRAEVGIPTVVGFGIDSRGKSPSGRDGARADGAVVGTAACSGGGGGRPKRPPSAAEPSEKLVRELRAGVDEGGASGSPS